MNNLSRIIIFSIAQALFSTLLASMVGMAAAFYVAKKKSLFARLLELLSAVPLSVPPLLVALGYVLFFGNNGSLNNFLIKIFRFNEAPISILYSFKGIIIAQGFYNFPLIMKAVADVWKNLPEEEEWAAQLLGASPLRVFRKLSFPHLLVPLASSASIVFLFCFFSFIIVLLFGPVGISTLEVEVYRASRMSLDFSRAFVLAIIETSIALVLVWFYSFLEKKGLKTEGASRLHREKTKMTKTSFAFSLILFSIIAVFFLFPLLQIPLKALFTKNAFKNLFSTKAFFPSLAASLVTAFFTAVLATSFALVYALFIRFFDPLKQKRLLRFFPYIPMAISSVVLGFVITSILFRFRLRPNLFLLSLCQSFLFWPFAFRQIQIAFDKVPHRIDEASSLIAPYLYRTRRVTIPLIKKGIVSALSFSFAMSLGDASLPLLLSIPKVQTLSLLTYRLAGSYRFAEACAAGTIILILSLSLFLFQNTYNSKSKKIKSLAQKEG